MTKSAETRLDTYQVRKTKKQKQAFIHWLTNHLLELGYSLQVDTYSKSGNNLIVGDVASAEIILGAHYDTQPNALFPMALGFSNWLSFCASQLITVLPFLVLLGLHALLTSFFPAVRGFFPVVLLLYSAFCIQLMCGVANKHTANDNTSGIATLLSILEGLPQGDRHKVCVVFFDQEELGLVGSQKFYQKYKSSIKGKPLINFDCVSDGETLTFVVKRKFRDSHYDGLLREASRQAMKDTQKTARFAPAFWNIYPSDQLHFPKGVGVVAAKKAPLFGYYINRIHSKWDTRFDHENIALLANTMLSMIRSL